MYRILAERVQRSYRWNHILASDWEWLGGRDPDEKEIRDSSARTGSVSVI